MRSRRDAPRTAGDDLVWRRKPPLLRHRGQAAHQARGRLAETASVAAALSHRTRAPQSKDLAIKPPRRRVGIVGEFQPLLDGAALQELFLVRVFVGRFGNVKVSIIFSSPAKAGANKRDRSRDACAISFLTRDSGGGGPACAAGRWRGRGPRRNSFNKSEASYQTPPPPSFALRAADGPPPPLSRGDMATAGKVGHFRPRNLFLVGLNDLLGALGMLGEMIFRIFVSAPAAQ